MKTIYLSWQSYRELRSKLLGNPFWKEGVEESLSINGYSSFNLMGMTFAEIPSRNQFERKFVDMKYVNDFTYSAVELNVPLDILSQEANISAFFKEMNVEKWTLGDIQSRGNHEYLHY